MLYRRHFFWLVASVSCLCVLGWLKVLRLHGAVAGCEEEGRECQHFGAYARLSFSSMIHLSSFTGVNHWNSSVQDAEFLSDYKRVNSTKTAAQSVKDGPASSRKVDNVTTNSTFPFQSQESDSASAQIAPNPNLRPHLGHSSSAIISSDNGLSVPGPSGSVSNSIPTASVLSTPNLDKTKSRSTTVSYPIRIRGKSHNLHIIQLPKDPSQFSPPNRQNDISQSNVDQIHSTPYYNGSFKIYQPFSLPQPVATKSVQDLLETTWMRELKDFLTKVPTSPDPIALVSSDYTFRGVLLNWLVTATIIVQPPISNILVISLDESTYELLKVKGIPCIYTAPASFLKPTTLLDQHTAFSQVMIIRLTVMRIINHWGFDIANYDIDALVRRNPLPLYQKYSGADIIGSHGSFPKEIRQYWGVTVCMGVIMIRNSPRTELFWEKFAHVLPETFNDQVKLNAALFKLNIRWKDHGPKDAWSIKIEAWTGEGDEGLSIVILPDSYVCRQTCSTKNIDTLNYYIWHKGGKKSEEGKATNAYGAGLWHLRHNWERSAKSISAVGGEWLKSITVL